MNVSYRRAFQRSVQLPTIYSSVCKFVNLTFGLRATIIHSQNTCDILTLETYYLNFIASQLYIQKWV